MAIGLICFTHAAEEPAGAPEAAKPPMDMAVVKSDSSHALGFRSGSEFARDLGRFGLTSGDLQMESFSKGFMEAFKGGQPSISEAQLNAAMEALGNMLQEREKSLAQSNLAEGKKFLDENGKRAGVVTTKSGMQYEVIQKGGEEKYKAPKEGEESNKQFLVNYKGTLISGKQFDASPEGQPMPMTLQVVEGFKEALTSMPVGAKWKIYLPANLAYGEERRSPDIGPNQTLIFDLELVKIEDAPAAPQGFPFPMPQGGE